MVDNSPHAFGNEKNGMSHEKGKIIKHVDDWTSSYILSEKPLSSSLNPNGPLNVGGGNQLSKSHFSFVPLNFFNLNNTS